MAEPYVFISYSRRDSEFVGKLADSLQAVGVQTWTDVENIRPGADWQKEIEKGLLNTSILIYVASKDSVTSKWMDVELKAFLQRCGRIIPIVIDDAGASRLPFSLRQYQWADFRGDYTLAFHKLVAGISFVQQPEPIGRPEIKSKGYVFISYAMEDSLFVDELKLFLGERGYAYWDFRESERDYNADFSLELEGVIREAAGTLSVISPDWKKSQILMQEFYFSKEVGTPVYILKVRDHEPTLVLSGLTYIDFTGERNKGFASLDIELKRKGLHDRREFTQAIRPGASLSYQIGRKEEKQMDKKRAFISFDYDHDLDLKNLLVGQAKNENTPFSIVDMSIKEPISSGWKDKARTRIKGCDVVIVICGEHIDSATGVSAELEIAQEEDIPYFLLWGRNDKTCVKPKVAKSSDKIYNWTWDNLKVLINGAR